MATTIPGGAYLSSDGKTWHDANGEPIKPPAALRDEPKALVEVDPIDAQPVVEERPAVEKKPSESKPPAAKKPSESK